MDLGDRGGHEDVGGGLEVGDARVGHQAGEADEVGEPRLVEVVLEHLARRAVADDEQPEAGDLLGGECERLGEAQAVLLGRDPADVGEHDVVVGEAERRAAQRGARDARTGGCRRRWG